MIFVLAIIPEQLIVEHHVFPGHRLVKLKFDILDSVFGLHVDEEVRVVEDGVNEQIWAVFSIVNTASRWLDEQVLLNSSLSFFQQYPAVDSTPQEQIRSEFIRLIIVNSQRLFSHFFFFFSLEFIFLGIKIALNLLPPGNGYKLLCDLLILPIFAILIDESPIQEITFH
jgi:hypothetical protein